MALRALFRILTKKTQNFTVNALSNGKSALYTTKPRSPIKKKPLFARISPLGDPDVSLVPILDQWVIEGGKVNNMELRRIIRSLRARRRYVQALEVSQWMGRNKFILSSYDRAVHLDLLRRAEGLDSAESYFNNLPDRLKNIESYGALLKCYVREGLTYKSLSLVQKMRELYLACSPLMYNHLMCLYTKTGRLEEVPDLLSDMKNNGLNPNNLNYRICLNSFGVRSDHEGRDKVPQELERQPHFSIDRNTYSMVANYYGKAGINENAISYLKRSKKIVKDAMGYNKLISLYASVGNKDEMIRLWHLQKANFKKQNNKNYVRFLNCLVKLSELEEAEKLLEEWESSCENYSLRVPQILLIGYCQKGFVVKAEELLRDMIKRRKAATPNSWSIVATGYAEKNNMVKAFECIKEALAEPVRAQNERWRPKPRLIASILSWLGDNADIEDVEAFVELLKTKVIPNREMYHALLKAYKRAGRGLDGVLERMKADEIEQDNETINIHSLQESSSV